MKKLFISLFTALLLFSAEAATNLKFENGLNLIFEACEDGSIRFETLGTKPKNPAKEFELKRKPSETDFVKSEDGSYNWEKYTVIPVENGYTLCFNGNEIYTSKFNEEPKLIREIRTWKNTESYYGFGHTSRFTNLSNQSLTIWNESKYGDHAYIFVPFYITDKNTAVYYNANSKDKIYFQNENDPQVYRSEYHRIECFVRQDSSAKESISKFYSENDINCMLPKWAYGFIQSKYGYKSSEEVIDLIEKFKSKNISLSAVVLDLYWFNQMGDISFTSPDFKNPKLLNEYMENENVKLVTITEPFFAVDSINYPNLKASGLLAKDLKGGIKHWRDWWCLGKSKEGALFNPLAKKASKFMGEKYAAMLDDGIDGFWTDLGEPEAAPEDIKLGKHLLKDIHNYYNFYWSKALYDGMKANAPDKRLFIMSRSGYTGSAKFNVSIWSGDVSASWPSFEHQLNYGVNAGISGFAYWGSDVGGFTPEKTTPELFVRWYQFGAFTPVFRAHGTDSREPWIFTEKEEKICSNVIKQRTELLPYIYSTARQTMNGIPMMRAMYLEDTTTPAKFNETQYMFGDSFLVAPVLKQLAAETTKDVWLPKGNWFNVNTMSTLNCKEGTVLRVDVTLDSIPVYLKSGAIIPCERDGKSIILVIPEEGLSNSFTLYNDDGETEQYKNGEFSEVYLKLEGRKLSCNLSENHKYLPEEFTIAFPAGKNFKTVKVSLEELKNGVQL